MAKQLITNLDTLVDTVVSSNVNVLAANQAVVDATEQAGFAEGSAASANTHAIDAANSAVLANGSVSDAEAQVVLAAAQAVIAADSATEASVHATDAELAKAQAFSYRNDALTYLAATGVKYDEFDDRYLGPKAVDPVVDNDGFPILEGALYWNTANKLLRVYTGGGWINAIEAAGFLTLAGNLADVPDKAAARTNLDVYSTTEVGTLLAAQNDAIEINYSNTTSGLVAINVQTAIDEVESRVDTIEGAASSFSGDKTFNNNVTVTGNFTVNGTTTTVNSTTVTTADNLIVINNGEVGTGVTAGTAGIQVDRGLAVDYEFIFDEADDTFKIGETWSLQKVATREDTPTDTGIAVWDAATSKFITTKTPTIDGLTVNGNIGVTGTVDGRDVSTDGSTLDAHVGASVAHGTTGNIVGDSDIQTLTNKTIDDITNYIGANHIHYPIRNESGVTIPEGTVITASSTQPGTDYLEVTPFSNALTQVALGITHTVLADNATGLAINTGVCVDVVDTSYWNEGTILYPASKDYDDVTTTTADYIDGEFVFDTSTQLMYECILNSTTGTLLTNGTYFRQVWFTTVKPTSGRYQAVAVVTRSHANQGTLIVEFTEPKDIASTTQSGYVQLNDTLVSTSITEALTANQGKVLKDLVDGLEAGKVANITAGTGIAVNSTDPLNPVVSALPQSAAGILSRMYATGDEVVLSSGSYYLAVDDDKGSVASVSMSVNVGDNEKAYFAQDFITNVATESTQYYAGSYAGVINVLSDSSDDEQRFTAEVYVADGDGVVIDSGITGATIGSLGVKVITILDTGIIDLAANDETTVGVSGILLEDFTLASGNRVRFHVSGEKIGTAGGTFTLTFFAGYDRNTYIDIPIAVTTDSVVNKSGVVGATATDAIDALDSTLTTHIGSTGSAHGVVTTSINGFMSSADKDKLDNIEAGATADQTASEVPIVDSGLYYTATNVEGALQEIMSTLIGTTTDFEGALV